MSAEHVTHTGLNNGLQSTPDLHAVYQGVSFASVSPANIHCIGANVFVENECPACDEPMYQQIYQTDDWLQTMATSSAARHTATVAGVKLSHGQQVAINGNNRRYVPRTGDLAGQGHSFYHPHRKDG